MRSDSATYKYIFFYNTLEVVEINVSSFLLEHFGLTFKILSNFNRHFFSWRACIH